LRRTTCIFVNHRRFIRSLIGPCRHPVRNCRCTKNLFHQGAQTQKACCCEIVCGNRLFFGRIVGANIPGIFVAHRRRHRPLETVSFFEFKHARTEAACFRDPEPARRPTSGSRHRRARRSDLPDDIRGVGPRGGSGSRKRAAWVRACCTQMSGEISSGRASARCAHKNTWNVSPGYGLKDNRFPGRRWFWLAALERALRARRQAPPVFACQG
jgi:hypothetical protein